MADGRFMSIDQNQKVVEIATPQDKAIAGLGVLLNKTYIPYGKMGQTGLARQSVQDTNALNASPTALVSRSVSKGNAIYCNDGWDLVDAITNGKAKLEELKTDDLPEDLRKLNQAARKAKVEEARKQRAEIQAKIVKLSEQREAFLAAERKKQATTKEQTLDQVMCRTMRDQAASKNFKFE